MLAKLRTLAIPLIVITCTTLAAIDFSFFCKSGKNLRDISIRLDGPPENLTSTVTVTLYSKFGNKKLAIPQSDKRSFTSTSIGPIKRIDVEFPAENTSEFLGSATLQISLFDPYSKDQRENRIESYSPQELSQLTRTATAPNTTTISIYPKKRLTNLTPNSDAINSISDIEVFVSSTRRSVVILFALLLFVPSVQSAIISSARRITFLLLGKQSSVAATKIDCAPPHHWLIDSQKPFAWLVLLTGLVTVIVLRDPYLFLMPNMTWEDGIFFEHFTTCPTLNNLVWRYASYTAITTNLFSFLITTLPFKLIPFVYPISALLFAIFQFSLFFHSIFRKVINDDKCRFLACLWMGLIPYASYHTNTTLGYSIWPQLFILCLALTTEWKALPLRRRCVLWVILAIFTCSNPLSIVILAPVAYRLVFQMDVGFFEFSLCSVCMAYHVFGVEHSNRVITIDSFSTCLDIAANSLMHLGDAYIRGALGQATFDSICSNKIVHTTSRLSVLCLILSGCVIPHFSLRNFFTCGFLMSLGVSAAAYIGRGPDVLLVSAHPRYAYIQSSFFIILITTVAFFCLNCLCNVAQRWSSLSLRPALLFISLLLVGAYFANHYTNCYEGSRRNGELVREFFLKLEDMSSQPPESRRNKIIVCEKENDTTLTIMFDANGLISCDTK
jgi:hypothetical protein